MKEIKINIIDWWNDDFEENHFIQFLSKKYKVVRSKNPDYLLCSCFGFDHLNFNCTKIFFTGENLTPDFNLYDYAMGFDYIDFDKRYLRYPLFLTYTQALKEAEKKHIFNQDEIKNRGFCSFLVSNGKNADPIRERFFDEISKIDFVASGGGFRNNIGKKVENKMEFLKQYKFNIAFENSQSIGYCTEKLIEAFAAKTIPIYWGDPSLLDSKLNLINPKSYINLSSFSSIGEALDFIKEVHSNHQLYMQILQEPAFLKENIQEFYKKQLEDFFDNIFSIPPPQGKQIVLSNTRKAYQDKQRRLMYIKDLAHPINFVKKRIVNFLDKEK
ncbi:glycosyltransferase family 10 domain-containing protein [Helicobacter brantae]|uniref:Glycosyltransferase n=1 Tax=Helicobacter brantae TaxID=375927 RepID=A0A3D8J3Z6_9HELI|nr:glycosyltransferase family 10 [Helicobacter brantae]RDU72198.1 glycosyltransferase [Helicobacter brantae]